LRKGKRTLEEKIQDSLKIKYEEAILHPVKGIFVSDINEGMQVDLKIFQLEFKSFANNLYFLSSSTLKKKKGCVLL